MRHLDLSDDSYAAQLTLSGLVKLCDKFQASGGYAPTSGGGKVKLGDACTTLAHWNGRSDPAQRGAVLFASVLELRVGGQAVAVQPPVPAVPPGDHAVRAQHKNATVRTALGDAIQQLNAAHIPIDTTLGAVQYVTYHGKHITIPGGPGDPDGIFNAIYEDTEPGDSLTSPDSGSSFIQVVTWRKGSACPVGSTILTYSESSNPTSPHFADQTKLFSKKQWLTRQVLPVADRRRPEPAGDHRQIPVTPQRGLARVGRTAHLVPFPPPGSHLGVIKRDGPTGRRESCPTGGGGSQREASSQTFVVFAGRSIARRRTGWGRAQGSVRCCSSSLASARSERPV